MNKKIYSNKDKIRFEYVEAHVSVTCAVCSYQFMAFPDIDFLYFNCPKCDRMYHYEYIIRPLNNQEIQAKKEKEGAFLNG
jgi:hypothetical protein